MCLKHPASLASQIALFLNGQKTPVLPALHIYKWRITPCIHKVVRRKPSRVLYHNGT